MGWDGGKESVFQQRIRFYSTVQWFYNTTSGGALGPSTCDNSCYKVTHRHARMDMIGQQSSLPDDITIHHEPDPTRFVGATYGAGSR